MANIEIDNTQEFDQFIRKEIMKYNKQKCEWIKQNSGETHYAKGKIGGSITEEKKIIGGAILEKAFDWLYIEKLWIKEEYRNKRLGTQIIKKTEELAKELKLIGFRVCTWDFQAKGFYEKQRMKTHGKLEDCPRGTTMYYLNKRVD